MTNAVTLLPWAALLSALALFFAWRAWKAGDRPAVLRRTGWALVPWALWLVGGLRLVLRVADAVADWAAGFVFRPSVWVGVAVALVAVAMIALGSRAKRPASLGGAGGRSTPVAERGVQGGAGGRNAGGQTASGRAADPGRGRKSAQDDDMAEIEDILRRHGIE